MGGTDHGPSLADLGQMAADGHEGIIVGWSVGGVCLILTFIILVVTVAKMLTVESNKIRNYCIAILFTPFVYCLCSYLALYFMKADVVFEYIKKIYEAVALYLYLLILVRYCGGYTALRDQLNEEVGKKKYFAVFPCCCLWCCVPKHKYTKWLLWFNKFGVLQLTIVRCIFMFLCLFLALNGWYEEGNIEFNQGYFYTKFVDAASLILCLWALFILYKAVHHILHQGRATTKFIAIKLIIILIFVQQCIFSILVKADAIPTDNDTWPPEARAQAWANFLICLECPIFGIIFWFAFTLKDAKYGLIEKEERKQRRAARRNEKKARKQEKREEKERKKEEKKQKKQEKRHKDIEMQPVSEQGLAQHEDEHSTDSEESSSASEEV